MPARRRDTLHGSRVVLVDIRGLSGATRTHEAEKLRRKYFSDQLDRKKLPLVDQLSGVVLDWMGVAGLGREYTNRGGGAFLFRGQGYPYPLIAAVGRPDARKDARTGKHLPFSAKGERWMFEQFVLRSRPHLKYEPVTDLDWLAVAQHHGMKTRLLDWTESFLVAVLFAVSAAGVDGPATLYAIPRPAPVRRGSDPFRLRRVGLYQPPDISPRITAQRGVFTVHPKPDEEYRPKGLEQWIIAKSACFNIKKQLHLCGLNESVVYPDLEGLSGYLNWRYKRSTSVSLD